MPAGDPDVVFPNPLAIVERLGRPERRAPGFGHLPALLPDEIGDARHSSLSRIERADALVDFRAQGAQLLEMGEQRPPDLFLILRGQALHFGNGLFKCLDHDAVYQIARRKTEAATHGRRPAKANQLVRRVLPAAPNRRSIYPGTAVAGQSKEAARFIKTTRPKAG